MLKGKTAIVTGSTSGIGHGMATALAAEGVNLVINGIEPPDRGAAIAEGFAKTHGVEAIYSNANLMEREGCEALVRAGEARFGAIDILINNAGVQHVAPIEDFPPEKWDAIIALNLCSSFHTIRTALPGMKKKGWGRIISLASAHGLVASPFKSAYVAAKHGVVGLTKVVALETAELDITCNAICPGYVWTPLVEKQIDDQARAHNIPKDRVIGEVILAPQPKKRFAQVEEIGALAVFLCSDAAASITGAALPVDGGWTAR
ncbi:MAG: 3-hydroxybutyrate dehydrogenase [Alphaproteobacteria bacterium]|nr:3-hydroxybutyrate dehydrogenase [Alphaproteobacteria bacterium]